jgi:hypothetical protein
LSIKTDCYWYEEWEDMNATFPCCKLSDNDILDSCDRCKEYHSKYHQTNADYIRQMTDEELAAWIWENDMLCFTRKEDVKEWLREEYSNEEE